MKLIFSSPSGTLADEDNLDCSLSKDNELIALLNFKLKKFNPTSKEFESGPPLTAEETKHKAIRFYSLQLKDQKIVKIDIDKFASLGGATLASLLDRSSKIHLKHPENVNFFHFLVIKFSGIMKFLSTEF